MTKLGLWVVVALLAFRVLATAGPTLVGITQATAPLVIAVGGVIVVLRLVWYLTNRY